MSRNLELRVIQAIIIEVAEVVDIESIRKLTAEYAENMGKLIAWYGRNTQERAIKAWVSREHE